VQKILERNRALSLCVFIVYLFLGFYQKNPQQWYQSWSRLFKSDKEAEERSSFVATTSPAE